MSKTEIFLCQVANPDVYLPCDQLVNGVRCEVLEPHDKHWVGDHTVRHMIAGKTVPCQSIGTKSKKETSNTTWSSGRIALMAILGSVLAVLLAAIVQFGPRLTDADPVFSESGAVTALNKDIQAYEGQALENANAEQKALTGNALSNDYPAFVYGNGNENENAKEVHIYIDFADRQSRDFVLLNYNLLQSLIESGKIELYLHAVPTGDVFSIYAAEVQAEAHYFAPESSWQFLRNLLRFAEKYETEQYSVNKLAKELASLANESGVAEIDNSGIQNGTFSSWLLSIAKDPLLARGTGLPSLYVSDTSIDLTSIDLASNSEFLSILGN